MTDPILQAYYDAHDDMIDAERYDGISKESWAMWTGLCKVARYNAVKAGLIPETPQFDAEDKKRESGRPCVS